MKSEEGFSHKALSVILESLKVHERLVSGAHAKSDPDLDEDWGDRANDLHYLQILIADVEERIERLVARLGNP